MKDPHEFRNLIFFLVSDTDYLDEDLWAHIPFYSRKRNIIVYSLTVSFSCMSTTKFVDIIQTRTHIRAKQTS